MKQQCLLASLDEQKIYLLDQERIQSWPISSALKGSGTRKNSYQTPLGWHLLRAKIGKELAPYSVLKARRFKGELCDLQNADPAKDWILSRILWLSGMQKGLNRLGQQDSMQRYIYIHGTNQENLIGQAVSHGCLRMKNLDVIELFEQVTSGSPLLIAQSGLADILADLPQSICQIDETYITQKNMLKQWINSGTLTQYGVFPEAGC